MQLKNDSAPNTTFEVTLIAADGTWHEDAVQSDATSVVTILETGGARVMRFGSGGLLDGNLDVQFLERTLSVAVPALCAAAGAWLQGRYGRKVRVKTANLEVEANTVEEVERLLQDLQELEPPTSEAATAK